MNPGRVLIYRLGSLGDTMVAMPVLKLAARAFPDAERVILTVRPAAREVSMAVLLEGSDLVHRFLVYERGERRPGALWSLARRIRAFRPDLLVYLAEPRGLAAVWRDVLFFRACGIRRVVGAPLTPDLHRHRIDPTTGLREAEAARLARCVAALGNARLDDPGSWTLPLSEKEQAEADDLVCGWPGADNFIAACAGAKVPVKDWGEDRWEAFFRTLAHAHPRSGLVLVGGAADLERSRRVAAGWKGPVLPLCGLSPRLVACVLRHARLFVGTDGGPMHLAAGMGVPTVALFADTAPFGVWFPQGGRHAPLYHPGGSLEALTVGEVVAACLSRLPADQERIPSTIRERRLWT